MELQEKRHEQVVEAVREGQGELKTVKSATEKTIENGRRDVREIKEQVESLTEEVHELSRKRDALHIQIQKEHIHHEKETQVLMEVCSTDRGRSIGRRS